jgi:hypothetical protein
MADTLEQPNGPAEALASRILTFVRDELGITLMPKQAEALSEFVSGGYEQGVWRWGRRSGKSLLADILVLVDALLRPDLRRFLRPGEPRISAIIAPRLDQAQAHISNIAGLVDRSPRLRQLLVSQTTDELTFSTGSVIKAYPCSARSVRGGAWSSCILDELGHYLTSEDGNAAGDRVLEAAQPSLAQFGEQGWLIAISTPLWKSGAFWKLWERASSGRFSYIQGLHASTAEVNPRVSARWLEARRLEDPDSYAREYLAEFIDGASAFLSSTDVLACVRQGQGVLPPVEGVTYRASIDPAFSHDLFALGIAHREADQLVVDGVWTWHRAGFESTLDQVVDVARRYRVRTLRTDQFSAQAVLEGLQRRHIGCEPVPWDAAGKWQSYSRLKALVNTRGVSLPDDDRLVQELVHLEARPLPSGATRIAAAGGARDDRASVLAALTDMLMSHAGEIAVLSLGGDEDYGFIPGLGDIHWEGDRLVRDPGPVEPVYTPPPGWEEL